MKPVTLLSTLLARLFLITATLMLAACGEDDPPPNSAAAVDLQVDKEVDSANAEEMAAGLRREIDSERQSIEDIEAFVQMERAKLEEDPEYDQSFLMGALQEQEEIRESVEAREKRLQELGGEKE